jgi:hypothetical protein
MQTKHKDTSCFTPTHFHHLLGVAQIAVEELGDSVPRFVIRRGALQVGREFQSVCCLVNVVRDLDIGALSYCTITWF